MGDRVVGLCNFCEVHGPRIVFVCQESSGNNGQKKLDGKQFYGDANLDLGTITSGVSEDNDSATTSESCDGCRAFSTSKPVYLTNDHKKRASYVSCQYPFRLDVFSRVRCACVRSLSCEACPGRQGPILFGDAASGYCLCYVFALKDSKARGFQHSYSIVIVSRYVDELIINYSYLVSLLKNVVTSLQSWTDRVFDQEGIESSDRLPQIAASGRASWVPNGFFLRTAAGGGARRLVASPRSLAALTDRNDVFKILHDMFVDLHQLAASSEIRGYRGLDCSYSLLQQVDTEIDDDSDRPYNKNGGSCHLCTVLERVPYSPSMAFKTLTQLHDILGSESFSMLSYHLLIGNQVVVRSTCVCLNRLLLDALKLLLPPSCIKCVDSSGYREPWECNLVGLLVENGHLAQNSAESASENGSVNSTRKLSQSWQNFSTDEGCVILCVETPNVLLTSLGISSDCEIDYPDRRTTHSTTEKDPRNLQAENSKFRMFCASPTASGSFFDIELPSLLQSLLHLLSNASSKSPQSEDHISFGLATLDSLKHEWMKKAKLYYVMSKTCDAEGDIWRKRFFRVSKCTPMDEPVLKFWRSGLDRSFKQVVLARCAARYQCQK